MNIINNLGATGKDNLGKSLFDKDHAKFREMTFMSVLKSCKDKYISKYRFEGDEDFTIPMQKTMLGLAFLHGTAGIYDVQRAVTNRLPKNDEFQEIYNSIPNQGIKLPLGLSVSHWDYCNRPVKGHGITTARHNVGAKSFEFTNQDTAVFKLDEDSQSGWYKWLPYAYLKATALTVLKKRVATMDKKLVSNNANNSYNNTDFEDLYDVTVTYLNISPSQGSTLTNNKNNEIDINAMLNSKLAKLDFTAQETVNELLEFIDANRNMWNLMFGERTNVNKKTDRNISDEFTSDEVHFQLMENDGNEQAQSFADDYKRLFGKELTVKIKVDDVLEEIQAQQRALSGGGADREDEKGKDNDNNN